MCRYFRIDERTGAVCIKDRGFVNDTTEQYIVQVRVEDGGTPSKVRTNCNLRITLVNILAVLLRIGSNTIQKRPIILVEKYTQHSRLHAAAIWYYQGIVSLDESRMKSHVF